MYVLLYIMLINIYFFKCFLQGPSGNLCSQGPEAVALELRLTAGSKATQQFLLHASDYVSWICTEDFGYTIDFSVKLWAR